MVGSRLLLKPATALTALLMISVALTGTLIPDEVEEALPDNDLPGGSALGLACAMLAHAETPADLEEVCGGSEAPGECTLAGLVLWSFLQGMEESESPTPPACDDFDPLPGESVTDACAWLEAAREGLDTPDFEPEGGVTTDGEVCGIPLPPPNDPGNACYTLMEYLSVNSLSGVCDGMVNVDPCGMELMEVPVDCDNPPDHCTIYAALRSLTPIDEDGNNDAETNTPTVCGEQMPGLIDHGQDVDFCDAYLLLTSGLETGFSPDPSWPTFCGQPIPAGDPGLLDCGILPLDPNNDVPEIGGPDCILTYLPTLCDLIGGFNTQNGACTDFLNVCNGSATPNPCTALVPLFGQLVGDGHVARENARETADDANDVESVPSAHAHTLTTSEADGEWKVSVIPTGLGNNFLGGVLIGTPPPPPGNYVAISLTFGDRGSITQPANYSSTNPGPNPTPWLNDPPPNKWAVRAAWIGCGAATGVAAAATMGAAAASVASIASGGAGVPAAVGAWRTAIIAGMAAGASCGYAKALSEDVGRWAASGQYSNCWGCAAPTEWQGTLLNVPGILSVTSHTQINDPEETPPVLVETAPPYEGYREMQNQYEEADREARHAAWAAHNAFREQVGGANATIAVNVPLIPTVISTGMGTLYFVGTTLLGPLYYSTLGLLVLACDSVCSGDALLTITSTGTGTLNPGDPVEFTFAGDTGAASINFLGLTASGLTLDGELGGTGGALTGATNSLL